MNDKDVIIIHEDEHLIVVNKDLGIEVEDNKNLNILTILKDKYTYLNNLFLVHRLDKFTSGLVVIARDQNTKNILEEMFKNGKIDKTYHAIIEGYTKNNKGSIEQPIGQDKKNPNKRIVMPINKGGKKAITHYRVIKKLKGHTLIELKPLTGRTHQLRVHSAAIGCPIIGDRIYSYNAKIYKMEGFALIAKSINFTHPITRKKIDITIDYNKEFLTRLKILSNNKK